jgi:hypothetical protein
VQVHAIAQANATRQAIFTSPNSTTAFKPRPHAREQLADAEGLDRRAAARRLAGSTTGVVIKAPTCLLVTSCPDRLRRPSRERKGSR